MDDEKADLQEIMRKLASGEAKIVGMKSLVDVGEPTPWVDDGKPRKKPQVVWPPGLTQCSFVGAKLTQCKFTRTSLKQCNFVGATFKDCDFTGSTLTANTIDDNTAFINCTAPDGTKCADTAAFLASVGEAGFARKMG